MKTGGKVSRMHKGKVGTSRRDIRHQNVLGQRIKAE